MSFSKLFSKNNSKVYVIAEIGGNFTTYEEAVNLIDAAKTAGADCVKIQTFRAATIASLNARFDMENTGQISQYDYFKKYEISDEIHRSIFKYSNSAGIDCFSTPSHRSDVDFLESCGVEAYKIGADDAVNTYLLKYIARLGKPVFLSTGMCTLDEIKESIKAIESTGNHRIVIFHTVSGYPTHPEDVNLNVLKTFQKEFPEYPIGFSDHSLTPIASIAAAALGARVLERHFTLDKQADGPDHMLSSTPDELKFLVDSVRVIEKMMGSFKKEPFGPEVKNRLNNRKSIVAIAKILKGGTFSSENMDIKRPGSGLEPKHFDSIIGKRAARDISADELIQWEDIEH